jgi:hypothetical protein
MKSQNRFNKIQICFVFQQTNQPSSPLNNHPIPPKPSSPPLPFFTELKTKQVWHPFILCLAVMVFQQFSGVNAIIFNTVTIFNAANLSINQHLATNIVGAVQLVATFSKLLL